MTRSAGKVSASKKHPAALWSALVALGAIATLLPACSEDEPKANADCPCSDGFKCCGDNVCVPEGELCGLDSGGSKRSKSDWYCQMTVDDGIDGTIETVWQQPIITATRVEEYGDSGNDGTVDSASYTTYDAQGREVLSTGDDDYDGTIDWSWATERDDFGRVAAVESSIGDLPEDRDRKTYSYAGPNLTSTVDNGIDSSIDSFTTYFRDAAGRIVRVETDKRPAGGELDGVFDWVTLYEYDAKGRKTKEETMSATGQPPQAPLVAVRTYSYDDRADGGHTSTTVALDADGKERSRMIYNIDASGRLLSLDDIGRTIKYRMVYTYDTCN